MTETAPAVEVRESTGYDVAPEPRTGLLVTLALAWFTVILWLAHFAIVANGAQLALISAAIALPTVVAASLLAGAAVGLATVSVLARRGVAATLRTLPRIGVGALPGLVTGGLAGAWILLTWQVRGSTAALAVAVGLAGLLGATAAAALPRAVAAAGVAATLAVFVAGFVINFLFRERLMGLFGADGSAASQYTAFQWFAPTAAALSALVGGLLAFWHLHRAEPGTVRWPSYLLAGTAPGVMLILAEVITRLGGSRLLALAGGSEPDSAAFAWDGNARLNHALVVLFLGPIIAMIAFGRTLPRRPETDEPEDAETADTPAGDVQTRAGQPN